MEITGFIYVHKMIGNEASPDEEATMVEQLKLWRKMLGRDERDSVTPPTKVMLFRSEPSYTRNPAREERSLLVWDKVFSIPRNDRPWADAGVHTLLGQMICPLTVDLQRLMAKKKPPRLRDTEVGRVFKKLLQKEIHAAKRNGEQDVANQRADELRLWKHCEYPLLCGSECPYCGG